MTRSGASLASAALALVVGAAACAEPQTVEVPSPSPFIAPAPSGTSASPSIYSPVPGSTGGPEPRLAEPSTTPTPDPAPDPRPDEPRPEADVAGIRCGDEEEDEVGGTKVITRTTCYPIKGTSMAQLEAQMRSKGPRAEDRRAIAVTRWSVRWSYDQKTTATGCELINPSVQTVAAYRFPTWKPPSQVAEATVSEYRAFLGEVRVHEGHHRALAVDAGVAIRKALAELPPAGTCGMLEKKADDAFDSVFTRYQAKQEAFDDNAL